MRVGKKQLFLLRKVTLDFIHKYTLTLLHSSIWKLQSHASWFFSSWEFPAIFLLKQSNIVTFVLIAFISSRILFISGLGVFPTCKEETMSYPKSSAYHFSSFWYSLHVHPNTNQLLNYNASTKAITPTR